MKIGNRNKIRPVIITGMDNSGKTTIAARVANRVGATVEKSPGPLPEFEQMDWIKKNIARNEHETIIFERFPIIEEMIYGTILRGTSTYTIADLKEYNPIVVYTRPARSTIFDFGSREQYPGVIEKCNELLSAYDQLMIDLMRNNITVICHDWEHMSLEELISKVVERGGF